jgi:cell pole-organizing protein PopZ
MNRPDKAGEQSMEEILASIRQIIADEPSSDRSAPIVVEANPLVPKSSGAGASPASGLRTPPLLDRLNGVLRNGSLPPTKPLGSKRPLSFDQDLADMFDEQDEAGDGLVSAPKPAEIRVPPDVSFPAAGKASDVIDAVSKPALNGASSSAAQLSSSDLSSSQVSPSQPFVPPLPFGGADSAAATDVTPVPTPRNFGFPPLRKQGGFYPAQNATPVLPPLPPSEPALDVAPAPSENPEDTLKRISGFGAVVPGEIASGGSTSNGSAENGLTGGPMGALSPFGATLPSSAPSSSTSNTGAASGLRTSSLSLSAEPAPREAVEAHDTMPALETPAPFRNVSFDAVIDAAPPVTAPPVTAPAATASVGTSFSFGPAAKVLDAAISAIDPVGELTTSPVIKPVEAKPIEVVPAPAPPIAERPIANRSLSGAFSGMSSVLPVNEPAPRFATPPAPDTTAAVAAQALDALAQGLAASAAASAISGVTAPAAVPLLTPVIEPHALQPFNALTPTTGPAGGAPPARTLEDAVADMLRPMLQQWVADNMPRIIEKALRTEVAKSIKPGSK